jgi:hypothetical protein
VEQREEADLPRRHQRHDLRPGRHYTVRGLRQRARRDRRRPGLLRDRLVRLVLPAQVRVAVQQGRRRARRGLYARHRRALRWLARRVARRPEHDRVPRARQELERQRRGPVLRTPEATADSVPGRADDHRLGRVRHLADPDGHQVRAPDQAARRRRAPRDRRRRDPRRGGVPGRRPGVGQRVGRGRGGGQTDLEGEREGRITDVRSAGGLRQPPALSRVYTPDRWAVGRPCELAE